jgi:hypothetical protein
MDAEATYHGHTTSANCTIDLTLDDTLRLNTCQYSVYTWHSVEWRYGGHRPNDKPFICIGNREQSSIKGLNWHITYYYSDESLPVEVTFSLEYGYHGNINTGCDFKRLTVAKADTQQLTLEILSIPSLGLQRSLTLVLWYINYFLMCWLVLGLVMITLNPWPALVVFTLLVSCASIMLARRTKTALMIWSMVTATMMVLTISTAQLLRDDSTTAARLNSTALLSVLICIMVYCTIKVGKAAMASLWCTKVALYLCCAFDTNEEVVGHVE